MQFGAVAWNCKEQRMQLSMLSQLCFDTNRVISPVYNVASRLKIAIKLDVQEAYCSSLSYCFICGSSIGLIDEFKERVMRFREDFVLEETKSKIKGRDHPALVEVIQDNSNEEAPKDEANEMPLLPFLARRGLLILTIPWMEPLMPLYDIPSFSLSCIR
uniref:Uncharacterized protein n=1 Tax=Salix viminalis TaxID=40686 RepID=A0A6N2N236_SALVM